MRMFGVAAGAEQQWWDLQDEIAGVSLPCVDPENGGLETPGLTSKDWAEGDADCKNEDAAEWCRNVCTVSETCALYALAANEQTGVWGGMTEAERKQWRRQRARRKQAEKMRGEMPLFPDPVDTAKTRKTRQRESLYA